MMETEVIDLEAFFSHSGAIKRRDEQYKDEFTKEMLENAQVLLSRVNNLLKFLNISNAKVSSGWRPPSVNATIPGAGKKSAHLTCQAIDILDDKDQSLAKLILKDESILEKFDLYLENPDKTIGKNTNWVHLQIRPASKRVFQS